MDLERFHLDKSLFYALAALAAASLLVIYSASRGDASVTFNHGLRLLLGFAVLIAVAQLRPDTLMRWSPYVYGAGLLMLLIVAAVGVIGKGAQRWVDLGVTKFQPSEIMKFGAPMLIAWFLAREALPPRLWQVGVGFLIALVPALLIAKQPDLGTAILVIGSGLFVLFLAGMGLTLIFTIIAAAAAAAPFLWGMLRDYQRDRILTLFNPEADPLGAGYHTIQSMIAIGSGGIFGKGWLNSTQAHLEYLPESKTDFVFSVFAEEFGLLGILLLVSIYVFIVLRSMMIAFYAQDSYSRLLAGGFSLTVFLYFFVNIGMVAGILPVVGIPLPVLSYGGSSLITLMAMFGAIMSIHTHRRIVAP